MGAFIPEEIRSKLREQRSILDKLYPDIHERDPAFYQFASIEKELPESLERYVMWEELSAERYWHSLHYMNHLATQGKEPLPKEEMTRMTETLIEQAMAGRVIASKVPLYSDVWEKLKASESHVRDYVTDEHEVTALNDGFWHCLKATAEPQKESCANKQLVRIMGHERFTDLFSFSDGVKRVEELPLELKLTYLHPEVYLHWYINMAAQLTRQKGSKESAEDRGKLFGPIYPIIYSLSEMEGSGLRELSNVYAKDIVTTRGVQAGIARVFERALFDFLNGYDDEGDCLRDVTKLSRILVDHVERGKKIAASIKIKDIHRIKDSVRQYLPVGELKVAVKNLEARVLSVKELDVGLLREWGGIEVGEILSPSRKTYVTNSMLKTYFAQRKRPNVDQIEEVKNFGNLSNEIGEKVMVFSLADLLRKKRWSSANNILVSFFDWNVSRKLVPYVNEYVETHGKIRITEDGLNAEACVPQYNYIPKFVDSNKDLVELISSE